MSDFTVEVVNDLVETSLFANLNDNLLNRICPYVSPHQEYETEIAAY